MPELRKATLTEISSDDPPRELSSPVEVQFNPTTLRLALSNQVEGGDTQARQSRQYLGSSSTTLTLDLVFDTADEGDTAQPRSVREKTAIVEKFVLPRGEGANKQAPPKLRFQWGTLVIDGLVDSVNIDFDHFAADGTPLRAKVSLAIQEQDARYQFLAAGPGANPAGNTPTPTQAASGGAPGTAGSGRDRVGAALAGESAADFAARMGLDPSAWRGLAAGLDATLSLQAGVEIGFSASVGATLGVGLSAGVSAGATASVEASVGLAAGGPTTAAARANPTQSAGYALAAAGGVGPAIETVKIAQSDAAQAQARAAFTATPGTLPVAPAARRGLPEQSRAPLARSGLPPAGTQAPAAPPPPQADPRAVSFGRGVPLRPTFGAAARDRALGMGLPPTTTDDPTIPRWEKLPAGPAAHAPQRRIRHGQGCQCGCARRR